MTTRRAHGRGPTTTRATTTVATAVARRRARPRRRRPRRAVPDDFTANPKLERQLLARRAEFDRDEIDWALAEALAFGSLVLEGTTVRLAGQDTRRGTFSQRHGVLVDQLDEHEYEPLNHLADDQAPFMVYDTVLSEYAALGFEYGYSIAIRRAGVLGGAVRRLRQRRAGHHRPVHRGRRRQVGAAQQPLAAAPARVRGPGPRALERAHRALPHALRRGQPARRVPVDGRAVLPRAAAPGHRRRAGAAGVLHAEALPAHAADALPASPTLTDGAFEVVLDDRAALDRDAVAAGARLHRQDRPRADGRARRARRAGRGGPRRAALPVAREPSCSRSLDALPRRARGVVGAGGAGEHGRVDVRARTAARACSAIAPSCATSPAPRAPAPPAAAPRSTTASSASSLAAAFADLPNSQLGVSRPAIARSADAGSMAGSARRRGGRCRRGCRRRRRRAGRRR